MQLKKFLSAHPKIFLLATILALIASLFIAVSVYFISKYWFPPVTAYPANEIGISATIKTNLGDIDIELTGPKEVVAQFTQYSRNGFYTNTHIHRVVKNLLIEMGDPMTKDTTTTRLWGQGSSAGVFKNITHHYDEFAPGTVAMSGSKLNTYGSQFFISTAKTPWLKGKHTIIGKVTSGMNIVARIESSELDSFAKPILPIKIHEVIVK